MNKKLVRSREPDLIFGAYRVAMFGAVGRVWGRFMGEPVDDSLTPPPALPGNNSFGNDHGHGSLPEQAELPEGLQRFFEDADGNDDGATPFGPVPVRRGATGGAGAAQGRRASPGGVHSSRMGPSSGAVGRRTGSQNYLWQRQIGTIDADESDVLKRARTYGGLNWRQSYGTLATRLVYGCISHADCEAKLSISRADDDSPWDVHGHGAHATTPLLSYTGKGISGEFIEEIDAMLNAVRRATCHSSPPRR